MFQALSAIMFSGMYLGLWGAFLPSHSRGLSATRRVIKLLDSMTPSPEIIAAGGDGAPLLTSGKIEFRNVTFAYPARPYLNVLEDFNLVIDAGGLAASAALFVLFFFDSNR